MSKSIDNAIQLKLGDKYTLNIPGSPNDGVEVLLASLGPAFNPKTDKLDENYVTVKFADPSFADGDRRPHYCSVNKSHLYDKYSLVGYA